ncbi:hypothetical protein HHI36_017280 [Cryptolaemus montrouzieri]|uniref:Uncharacterized protein n=1 Tax=Cryptolaemus montrouzieri TaxID=559131 RepID=A0ABD2NM29_9CUCU
MKNDDIHSTVLEVHLTDHYPIVVIFPSAKVETIFKKLSKKVIDYEGLETHIISPDWDSMLGYEDIDGTFVQFVEILKNAVNQYIKEVPVRARNKNHEEWITEELSRNRVVNLIKTIENNYYISRFEEPNKSSEALRHWLWEVTNSKKCKTCAIE